MQLLQRAQINQSCKLSTTTCTFELECITGSLAFRDIFQSAKGIYV